MTDAERDAFLREVRIGTLCTLNEDGSPNALPLWYEWDGEKARMFSMRDTGKVTRLRRDPRACLSVADPVGAPEAWVTVEGTIEIFDRGRQGVRTRTHQALLREPAAGGSHRRVVREGRLGPAGAHADSFPLVLIPDASFR